VFSTIILYILNIFIPYIALFLSDIPYFTVFYFQIWRLITTPFMTTGILSIIFSLIFWFKDAVKLEKELGTVKYMLVFFMNTLCIQILYCLVTLLISLIIQNTILMRMKVTPNGIRNEGLWPILMCDLTLLCLNNPEEPMRLFLFPCIIKAKYYPLVLFLIFTILSGFNIDFEVLCAISFGFLYHFYLKNLLKITNNFAMKVENSFLCRWMKSKKGFVNTGGVTLPQLRNNLENVRNVVVNGNNANPQGGFRAFRGKGVAVGGGNTNNNASANSDSNINSNSDSRNETTDDNNISVGSSGDLRSSDSRMDLNSSNPKS
jgi:membrane associated rhomboid family serine protease